nr:uncharacterized protein LOC117275312 [Nicotiana tomentosiformis]
MKKVMIGVIVASAADDCRKWWSWFEKGGRTGMLFARKTASFLASEDFQRLIRRKEELTSARDQLLAEREQTVARLSELEAKAAEAIMSFLLQPTARLPPLKYQMSLLRG